MIALLSTSFATAALLMVAITPWLRIGGGWVTRAGHGIGGLNTGNVASVRYDRRT